MATEPSARRGRRPLPVDERLSATLAFRVSGPEFDALCHAARERRMELRTMLREMMGAFLRRPDLLLPKIPSSSESP